MVANIIWTVLSGLAILFFIGSFTCLNVLPLKWLVSLSIMLILFNILIDIRMFKAKRVGRDLALVLAFLIFLNSTLLGIAGMTINSSLNKITSHKGISKTKAVTYDDPYIVFIKLTEDTIVTKEGTEEADLNEAEDIKELIEAERETLKKAAEAAAYAGEPVLDVDEEISKVIFEYSSKKFAVVNPSTQQILVLNIVFDDVLDDKAAIEEFEAVSGLTSNYSIKFNSSDLDNIGGLVSKELHIDDIFSDTSTIQFFKWVVPGILKSGKIGINAFENALNTDVPKKSVTYLVKRSLEAMQKPTTYTYNVDLSSDDNEMQLAKMKEIVSKVVNGEKINANDLSN